MASSRPAPRPSKKHRRTTLPKAVKGGRAVEIRKEVEALRQEVRQLSKALETLRTALDSRKLDPTTHVELARYPTPELFYGELRRAMQRLATPLGTAAIPDLREAMGRSLHIDGAVFDEALVGCWLGGLVLLEPGNPIGGGGGGHLLYQGRKYYYVRLPAPGP